MELISAILAPLSEIDVHVYEIDAASNFQLERNVDRRACPYIYLWTSTLISGNTGSVSSFFVMFNH